MSTSSPSTPAAPVAPPTTPPAGKNLRTGDELTESEAGLIAHKFPTRLVILAGPPDSGKTTLLATIYEMLRKPPVGLSCFAWSQSLVAFERRCHLSRVASGMDEGATERTPYSDEQRFYHLRLAAKEQPTESVDLLFFDLVGERFNHLRASADECRRVNTLGHATFLDVLLDGSRIEKEATRHLAIEECVNFLQACADSKALSLQCRVQIVITKFDCLSNIGDEAAVAAVLTPIQNQIRQRLARRFPALEFVSVAARPKGNSSLSAGYGVDQLLSGWTQPADLSIGPEIPIPHGPFDREAEAFGVRQLSSRPS